MQRAPEGRSNPRRSPARRLACLVAAGLLIVSLATPLAAQSGAGDDGHDPHWSSGLTSLLASWVEALRGEPQPPPQTEAPPQPGVEDPRSVHGSMGPLIDPDGYCPKDPPAKNGKPNGR